MLEEERYSKIDIIDIIQSRTVLADIVFVILSSSPICETNFRDYKYIMDKRRLRLKPELGEKLIFIYCNKIIKE